MGNCLVPSGLENEVNKLTKPATWKEEKTFECQRAQYKHVEENTFKMLILGTGESGKSTLVKQMKLIHNDGYDYDEVLQFKPIILDNLVSSMKYVVTGMRLLDIPFQHPSNKYLAKELILCTQYFDEYHTLHPHLDHILTTLWDDFGVKEAASRGFEYELNDSALFFFENMSRITSEKYEPSTEDILKARIRTIGVTETAFRIQNKFMTVYDVGGQRSERRKWLQCFDDVRAVLFVAAISEFDMTLVEDSNKNRLRESLELFESVCNNIFFRTTITMLFLNKIDLFRHKILYTDRQLKHFFPEYTGPDYSADHAAMFIEQSFRSHAMNVSQHKPMFTHFITATDTDNIQGAFSSVINTILADNVRQSTLL